MYLLDTDILNALKAQSRNPRIVRWLESTRASDLFLSAVSIAEVETRIARMSRNNPSAAAELAAWLDGLVSFYGDRVLGVDLAIARRWGRLSSDVSYEGADLLVAATALERGLTLVTRSDARFRPLGVQTFNPSAAIVGV